MTARTPSKAHMHELHKRQSQSTTHAVQTETVATQTDATGNPGTGSKKKKKKKKKKKSDTISELASERASEIGLEDEEGHSESEDESVTVLVRSHRSNSAEVEIERSQHGTTVTEIPSEREAYLSLPLSVRLEKAASHPDFKAGLHGLVEWSNAHLSPDVVDIFFQSKALKLLLENLFRVCPVHSHLFDSLTALFANLFAGTYPFELADGRKTGNVKAARLVVQSIRSTVDSLRSLKRYKDKAPMVASLIPQVSASLTKLIVSHQAQNALQPSDGYDLATNILKLDETLQSMVATENAIRGQTIRDTFRRRDLRADAVAVSGQRMTSLLSLVVQANAKRATSVAVTPELAPSAAGGIPALDLDGQDVTSIEARLSQLHKEKVAQLAPWQEKKEKVSNELMELKLLQDELRKKLADVDSRLHILQHLHGDMVGEMAAIEATFEDEIGRFGAENMGVVSHLQGVEKKQEIVGAFRGLRTTLDDLSASALRHKMVGTTAQHLEGVLRYVSAQAICVQFTKNRLVDADTKRTKLQMEMQATESLGDDATSLMQQIAELRALISEDKKNLRADMARDADLRTQLDALLATLQKEGAKDDATVNDGTVAEIHDLFAKIFSVYALYEGSDDDDDSTTVVEPRGAVSVPATEEDELEMQITQENLARLEQGQRPTRAAKH